MKSIDWKLLAVLYEKKSITKAAAALYMTQPSLTKRLKSIEAEWNVNIVNRSHQGVTFTEEGVYLCQKATVMLDFLQEIKDHFATKEQAREVLRIGVPNSIARLHLPGLLKAYQEQYNALQVQTLIASSDRLVRHLLDGEIDIAVVCGSFSYVGEQVQLFSEELYAMMPRGTALDDLERLPLIESYLNPTVKPLIDQWWKGHFGNSARPAHIVPYHDIAIEMVEQGLGCTLIFGDKWDIDVERTQMIPLQDTSGKAISRPVWMLMSNRCFLSRNITDFISVIEAYYQVNGYAGPSEE